MANAGETLENPVTSERITFRKTAADTNGEALEYEIVFRPSGFVTQEHLHPQQEERHEVVSGSLGLSVDGEDRVLNAGDVVVVPRGTAHRLFPVGEEPVHAVFESRPALRSEALIETIVRLAREGKLNRKGRPGLLQLAVIAREFEDEGYPTKPPLPVQRALFGPLAALGRLRGYSTR